MRFFPFIGQWNNWGRTSTSRFSSLRRTFVWKRKFIHIKQQVKTPLTLSQLPQPFFSFFYPKHGRERRKVTFKLCCRNRPHFIVFFYCHHYWQKLSILNIKYLWCYSRFIVLWFPLIHFPFEPFSIDWTSIGGSVRMP